jgi:hypothetical protein
MAGRQKKGPLRVSAPLVQVRLNGADHQLRFNDEVPEGVSDESIKHLKDLGYVTEGDAVPDSDES